MPVIPIPLIKSMEREVDGEVIHATFRQATMRADMARKALFAEHKQQYNQAEVGLVTDIFTVDLAKLQAFEVWQTIVDCDITDERENSLFRKDMTEKDFMRSWGQLPPAWGIALHGMCLEVNPDWDFEGARSDEKS